MIWGKPVPHGSPSYSIIFGADLLYSHNSAVNPSSANNVVGGDTGGVVGLMRTVSSLLRKDDDFVEPLETAAILEADYTDEDFDHPIFATSLNYTGGYFLLGIARRSLDLAIVIKSMHDNNLIYCGVVDDSVIDIFGNETDGISDFWTTAVIACRLRGKEGKEGKE
jgi:hypothetical protein